MKCNTKIINSVIEYLGVEKKNQRIMDTYIYTYINRQNLEKIQLDSIIEFKFALYVLSYLFLERVLFLNF